MKGLRDPFPNHTFKAQFYCFFPSSSSSLCKLRFEVLKKKERKMVGNWQKSGKKVKTFQFCEKCLRAKQNALSLTWTQGSFVHYLALILSLFKNISLHKSFTRNLHKIAATKIILQTCGQSVGASQEDSARPYCRLPANHIRRLPAWPAAARAAGPRARAARPDGPACPRCAGPWRFAYRAHGPPGCGSFC